MNVPTNDYVKEWLGAYLDGELSADRRAWVEDHLAGCPVCQRELTELRALAQLLHADPAPAPFLEPQAFSRQVLSRLPAPRQSTWQRLLGFNLRFAPLWLFGAWAFFQAVILVSTGLFYALRLFPEAGGIAASLEPRWNLGWDSLLDYTLFGSALSYLGLDHLTQGIGGAFWIGPLAVINLVFLALLSVLFFAWLGGLYSHYRVQSRAQDYVQS